MKTYPISDAALSKVAPALIHQNNPAAVQTCRRILCKSPHYAHSFGTFCHTYKIMKVKAFMPPQGIW